MHPSLPNLEVELIFIKLIYKFVWASTKWNLNDAEIRPLVSKSFRESMYSQTFYISILISTTSSPRYFRSHEGLIVYFLPLCAVK